MRISANTFRKLTAWAGILAPVLFVGIFTVEGLIRPGYDPANSFISALSLGPRGWIQIINFVLLGGFLLAFSRGIAAEFQTGKASRAGKLLLMILAALFLISGPFVMDPADTLPAQMSVHGVIHGLAGGFVFLLMPVIIFVYGRRFREDPRWQSFWGWTLALGVVEALAVMVFVFASKGAAVPDVFAGWMGLIQRSALIPFFFWVFLFGLILLGKKE